MPMSTRFKIFILSAALLNFSTAPAQQEVSYKQVDAIFQDKCVACHGHTTRQSGLNLESFDSLMAGGKRGAAINAGKSGESLLVKYIDGTLKPRMPLGDELSAEEIGVIKAWIDAGAKAPGVASATGASKPVAGSPAESAKSDKPGLPEL